MNKNTSILFCSTNYKQQWQIRTRAPKFILKIWTYYALLCDVAATVDFGSALESLAPATSHTFVMIRLAYTIIFSFTFEPNFIISKILEIKICSQYPCYMIDSIIEIINSLQCIKRSLVPKAKISSTTHVQLLQWLHGKQQQHIH